MNRILTLLFLIVFLPLLALVACGDNSSSDTSDANSTAGGQNTAADQKLLDIGYSFPDAAQKIEDVHGWLTADKEMSETDMMKVAAEQKTERDLDGTPFQTHVFEKNWAVTADTPTLFSITAETYTMQGGANGLESFEVLTWSRAENKFMLTAQIFDKPLEFIEAIRTDFCTKLDGMRAERRTAVITTGPDDPFNACPALGQFPIAAVEKNGKISGFNIYLADNVAGPHAEGTYTVFIPANEDIINMVRTPYVSDF